MKHVKTPTKKRNTDASNDKRYIDVIRGLLKIAAIAMPDTYWQSDSRIRKARKLLKEHGIDIDAEKDAD